MLTAAFSVLKEFRDTTKFFMKKKKKKKKRKKKNWLITQYNFTLLILTLLLIKTELLMVLLHDFGASVFSWNRVKRPLCQLVGAKVLSFDRPAFGLTSRLSFMEHSSSSSEDSSALNLYSMEFYVLVTSSFIDLLATKKAILMGHSAGSLVAVNLYFEAPERVAALFLIAPAILAPFVPRKATRENQMTRQTDSGWKL